MKRFVIYTAIVGGYDEVHQPLIIDDRFDYILFTDMTSEPNIGVWKVLPLPYRNGSNMVQSRFPKCNSHIVLSEYEASLWLDGTMQIASPHVYERFFEMYEAGVEWASIKHPAQDCIYEEMCAIIEMRWVTDMDVVDCYSRFKKNGFPENWGLYENNIIYRRHTHTVSQVNQEWWADLANGGKRDQFFLMVYLRKYQPKMDFFLSNGECPRLSSEHFNYFYHNPHKRIMKFSFHEMMRYRIIRTIYPNNKRRGYREMLDWVSRFDKSRNMLYVWEIMNLFYCAPKMIYTSIKNRL